MMINFVNFFYDKTLKSVSLFMLKQVSHLLSPQHDDPFSLINGQTFVRTKWLLKL